MNTFEFEDGNGPVPAHKHPNGGGWVANTASVDPSAFVGPNARVFGDAEVSGDAEVYGNAWVFGNAKVFGDFQINTGTLKTGEYSSILDTLDLMEL